MATTYDVLVVGAGPTGLMLAAWLARAGVPALVIDDKAGPANESRAVGVQARTMETYDMMGLGERARAEGVPAYGAAVWVRGRNVARAILAEIGGHLSPHPYMFVMGQDRTERMLLADLRAFGGDVAYGTTFEGLVEEPRGVTATIRRPDGATEEVRARYLCACDGASSPVRQALGIDFPGGTYPQRFFVADVEAEGRLGHGELGLCVAQGGFLAFFPMLGPRRFRIIGIVPEALAKSPDLAFEDLRGAVERHSGMRVPRSFWFATYNVHHRVAERFRRGRVFLLGDAGHIHSPVGGQGMNTGLMDAANLAWKLAAVLRGAGDERLLASYEPERRPFARKLVATTDRIFTLVSSPSAWIGRVRAQLVPLLFAGMTHLPWFRRELFGLVSQTRVSYRHGPLARGKAGRVAGGDRLPWVAFAAGGTNYDALRLLRPHVQVYGPVPPEVRAFAAMYPEIPLVEQPGGGDAVRAGLEPGAFYFVRPDGHVAYAASRFDADDFATYLREAWGALPEDLDLPMRARRPEPRVSLERLTRRGRAGRPR